MQVRSMMGGYVGQLDVPSGAADPDVERIPAAQAFAVTIGVSALLWWGLISLVRTVI